MPAERRRKRVGKEMGEAGSCKNNGNCGGGTEAVLDHKEQTRDGEHSVQGCERLAGGPLSHNGGERGAELG